MAGILDSSLHSANYIIIGYSCLVIWIFISTDDVKKAATLSKAISLKDFAAHVAEMHKNNNHGFENEFEVHKYILKLNMLLY